MELKDKHGNVLNGGDEIKDKDDRKYKIIHGDFENSSYGQGDDLIADGGFKKMLLWPERSKEFTLVKE